MKFDTYLINLDRATERLRRMDARLQRLGIPYNRIPAVLGDRLKEPIEGFDETGFRVRTGKQPNKREIGCYFSHLKVMETFLEEGRSHALVLEDDALLPDNLTGVLESALDHADQWDLLRLSSSRTGEFIPVAGLAHGHQLAINTRVLKNTAAYLINRKAAQRCLDCLLPMKMPFDVALDRDWTMDLVSACVRPLPVTLDDVPGQIPKAPRVRWLRATTFHWFHLVDHVRRKNHRRRVAAKLAGTPR